MNVTVVHRDAHFLVLSKPPRLPTTHPTGGDCLVRRAATLDPDAPHLHASSRLDAEVTGMVTFARTKRANEALRRARHEGRYGRLYLALAMAPDAPTLAEAWTEAIAMDPADPRRRRAVPAGTADAKESRTHPTLRAHVGPLALLAGS